ncbi:hypothetical protein KL86APRO_10117 [uncultured Alphaproteobacteria bacterium]|uniref:Uncharacterized protein n=1 Tax=uncultured Alphaproteobacteria bacterium TaxID=91750 RepID=A0A212IW22_9PROT|nr:hypothetical protein KL86APRO_10117 [uncultured Alphaproteobacteria bacterium]
MVNKIVQGMREAVAYAKGASDICERGVDQPEVSVLHGGVQVGRDRLEGVEVVDGIPDARLDHKRPSSSS